MSVEIIEVKSSNDRKLFVNFLFQHYKGNKFWVPPIKADEIKFMDPTLNPAYEFCESKFWYAKRNNKIVGRIGAVINHAYNEKIQRKIGRFSRLEFIDDHEVFNSLLQTAENWLKEKGMEKIHGPLGFTNLDNQGLLIDGFNYLPSFASVYNYSYYQKHIENYGFEKEIDWLEFRLTIGEQAVAKAKRGADLISKRYGIEVLHFQSEKEMSPYSKNIFQIINDSFDDLPFVTKFSEKMIEFYSEKYTKLLNPEFVKMVKMNNEVIGFIVGMPSLSKALQEAGGKLFPFGFWPILQARKGKNGDTMDQVLTGVVKEHQATGAAVILMAEIQNVMLQKGLKYIETTGIFETNSSAISNWKNYEHIQHKKRRCFIKNL